jgi:hypothetical protein
MKEQVIKEQEPSVTWSDYFDEKRDWLTAHINALEEMAQIRGTKRPTLDLTWILGLYHLARDYLDAFDLSHAMLHEMKNSLAPLEEKVATLESGKSASEVNMPKIPVDWNVLASTELVDHLTNSTTKPAEEETILPGFERKKETAERKAAQEQI